MLGLYLYTLIISHTSCNMLSILNTFTLQKNFFLFTNTVMRFWTKKVKTQQQQQNIKHRNPCRSRELNPEPFAAKADALRLHHRVN